MLPKSINDVQLIKLPFEAAANGDLVVIEGVTQVPFSIARVFFVRASERGAIRGNHAHKLCTQFLTCPFGKVAVHCDDGSAIADFILDEPDVGLLIPPGIWAQQTYSVANSVLTVLCDRPYEIDDYIRNYDDFTVFRGMKMKIDVREK